MYLQEPLSRSHLSLGDDCPPQLLLPLSEIIFKSHLIMLPRIQNSHLAHLPEHEVIGLLADLQGHDHSLGGHLVGDGPGVAIIGELDLITADHIILILFLGVLCTVGFISSIIFLMDSGISKASRYSSIFSLSL